LNSYTDLNAPNGPIYYQIEVVNPNGCDPFKQTDYGVTRSNISNNGMSELETLLPSNSISISPNPNDGFPTLKTDASLAGSSYSVRDGFGRILFTSVVHSTNQPIDLSNLASGTYYLTIEGIYSHLRIVRN